MRERNCVGVVMNSKNALYFCGGVLLGIAGTIAFLWLWEDKHEEDISEPLTERVSKTGVPAVDKSSLDDTSFELSSKERTDYSMIATKLYSTPSVDDEFQDDPSRVTDEKYQDLASNGYDTQTLTVYSDGILADSTTDDVMSESDAFAALGPNYTARKLQRIFSMGADSELDAVYIRNDRLYTLYEITNDDRTYKEVTGRGD